MAFNKYMHPRNRYIVPPNFKQLAIEYPEFRKHLRQDLSGKLKFNFHDAEALCIFTTTLLKKDFGLAVDIPPHCLVPTLPLRLNYILWIEDLLQANQIEGPVHGIDIGSGASCVYPLLACSTNSWSMLALECDPISVDFAQRNVQENNLQDLISVKHTSSSENSHLESYLEPNVSYTFTMCNPPFFASSDDLNWEHGREENNDCNEHSHLNKRNNSRTRNKRRKPPHNAQTGNKTELIAEGGEVSFVKKLIRDNIELKQIKIFTTMLGHKSSFIKVNQFLMDHPLVKQVSFTEFCQGNTMRWGLAWTANDNIKLPSTLPRKESGKSKSNCKPVVTVLEGVEGGVRHVVNKLLGLCDTLQIIYKILQERSDSTRLELTAYQNTWSHQRRLKRMMKKQKQEDNEIKTEEKERDEDRGEKRRQKENEMKTEEKEGDEDRGEKRRQKENEMKTEEKEGDEDRGEKRRQKDNGIKESGERSGQILMETDTKEEERSREKRRLIEDNEMETDVKGDKGRKENGMKREDEKEVERSGRKRAKTNDDCDKEHVNKDCKVKTENGNHDNELIDNVKDEVERNKNVKVVGEQQDGNHDGRGYFIERVNIECNSKDMKTKDNVSETKNSKQTETSCESTVQDVKDNAISDRHDTVKKIRKPINVDSEGYSSSNKAEAASNDTILIIRNQGSNCEGNSTNKAAANGDRITRNQNLSANQISSKVPLVVCNVLIENVEMLDSKDSRIVLEMIWVSGSGSRDLPHQIMQCFRNHL